MKFKALSLFLFLFSSIVHSQEPGAFTEQKLIQKTAEGDLEGSLMIPAQSGKMPVVLIIAGSGPTDRNGNNDAMENNSLKLIAEALYGKNIASFRFDKRGVAQSSDAMKDEKSMSPETYVNDVKGWINILAADKRFDKIIVAGHSEGSLFGMLASINNPKVKGFVSIAGAGRPIDVILKEQFSDVSPEVKTTIYGMIDQLKKGDTIPNVPVILQSLFRPSVQPYMTAWMKYDPAKEIKKLTVPVFITNGDKDIQVKVIDAKLLAKAKPGAELKIIHNMNHVLKTSDTLNKSMQMHLYTDPNIPLNKDFSEALLNFMTKYFLPEKKLIAPAKK